MDERPEPDAVFDLFGDEYVRTIVRAASREPMSVKELSEECGSALSTVYRRVDELVDAGLLIERTKIMPDGSHHSVYETAVDELTVRVADGAFDLQFEVKRDPARRFTNLWRDMREV